MHIAKEAFVSPTTRDRLLQPVFWCYSLLQYGALPKDTSGTAQGIQTTRATFFLGLWLFNEGKLSFCKLQQAIFGLRR